MQDRLGESDTLEHTFRVGMESLVSRVHKSYFGEDFIFSFREFFTFESIERSIEVEKLISGEIFIEVGILWHEPDFLSDFLILYRSSEDLHLTLAHIHDTEDTLHGRGFSGTIWTEKSEHFPFFEEKVNIIEEGIFSDFFGEMEDFEGVAHRRKIIQNGGFGHGFPQLHIMQGYFSRRYFLSGNHRKSPFSHRRDERVYRDYIHSRSFH